MGVPSKDKKEEIIDAHPDTEEVKTFNETVEVSQIPWSSITNDNDNKPEEGADVTADNNNWSEVTDDDSNKPDSNADVTADNTAADIAGQGDLATTNEADADVLNMTNAPAEAGADVTGDHEADIALANLGEKSFASLTAGTITSKAITLAVSAGTGDAKIQAGKTDFGDTTNGLILGIDDSDSDKPKFEIGDAYNEQRWTGDYFKLKGLLELGTYHIMGHRNDGFEEITTGAATITRDLMVTTLKTTATAGSSAKLKSQPMTTTTYTHANTFGANIKYNVSLGSTTDDDGMFGYAGLVEYGQEIDITGKADTSRHIGFYIEGVAAAVPKVYATNADGTTQTITEIGVISSPFSVFRFEKRGTGEIRFYRNDVLVATHTTHIPGFAITYTIDASIGNNAETSDFWLVVGNNYQIVTDY